MFGPDVQRAIQAHAIACYPEESCGAVTEAGYEPLVNRLAGHRPHAFECNDAVGELLAAGRLLALVHSHPDGPNAPSAADIGAQRSMDVPWGLVVCNDSLASVPFYWGDSLTPPPLLERPFRHGPSGTDGCGDCGALVRDYFRLTHNILIPDFPRDDEWWTNGQDLYADHYEAAGFVRADRDNARPGDVALIQWRTPASNPVANHAGIFLGQGLILHHLDGRLSRQEPIIGWMKFVRGWLRHSELVHV